MPTMNYALQKLNMMRDGKQASDNVPGKNVPHRDSRAIEPAASRDVPLQQEVPVTGQAAAIRELDGQKQEAQSKVDSVLYGQEMRQQDRTVQFMDDDAGSDSGSGCVPVGFDLDDSGGHDEPALLDQDGGQEHGSSAYGFHSDDSLVRDFGKPVDGRNDVFVPVPGSGGQSPPVQQPLQQAVQQGADVAMREPDASGQPAAGGAGCMPVQGKTPDKPGNSGGVRRASRWSDQPVSGAYRNRDGQMVTDETGMQVSHLKKMPQHIVQHIRDQFPAARSMDEAVTAYVYVREGCPADMVVTERILEVARSYRGPESDFTNETLYDNLLQEFDSLSVRFSALMAEFNKMKSQQMAVMAKVSAVEMGIVYELCDRIGFRVKPQDSPATINFLETCVSDMMAQLERNSAMKTGRDSVRSGRPIR